MEEVETFNKFMVSMGNGGLVVLNPPRSPMSNDEALLLAAWLVAMADPGEQKFQKVLTAVCNT